MAFSFLFKQKHTDLKQKKNQSDIAYITAIPIKNPGGFYLECLEIEIWLFFLQNVNSEIVFVRVTKMTRNIKKRQVL